jgi:hypothetical protein
MPRPKRILSGDEYITKTEKMIGLPKKYPNLSKTEKMQYLPRFYYNNYEKIDDGFLDYITITHQTIYVELNLRPDTAFGYPTWKSVFGGYDYINYDTSSYLFNATFNNEIEFWADFDFRRKAPVGYIDAFIPYGGGFYSFEEGLSTWFLDDNLKFANAIITSPAPKYMTLQANAGSSQKNKKIQLFNNNRAKVVHTNVPF